jgi:hypothetical protein
MKIIPLTGQRTEKEGAKNSQNKASQWSSSRDHQEEMATILRDITAIAHQGGTTSSIPGS